MEAIIDEIQKLRKELVILQKKIDNSENIRYFENWIPRKKLMEFFEYGDTQIAAIFKKGNLQIAEIGNRKFIKKESVIKMLEKNIISKK